ncbi:M14 family zinc carboxypeptidase [Ahniella affigens]|nr:M14 family zinc carboxypeptidase [Ahniella affigens]
MGRRPTISKQALSLMLLGASAGLHAQALLPTDIEVVRVETRDAAIIQRLAVDQGHLIVDRRKGLVVFDADAKARDNLRSMGLNWTIDQEATRALTSAQARFGNQLSSIPGFSCYRTVSETKTRLAALALQYPTFAEVVDIGDTWEKSSGHPSGGEDLLVLKLGNSAVLGDKPKVFVMSSVHAREYTPAELTLRFAEMLLANKDTDPEIAWMLDHQEFHFLVHANPDGRKQAETGLSWRKNTNTAYCSAGSTSRGADLNRNWPFKWGSVPNDGGSSSSACDYTYRGPLAASEPETQATIAYVRGIFGDHRGPGDTDPADTDTPGLFFDLHSYSQLVLWPWGWTNNSAPNAAALESLGRRFAKLNSYTPQAIIDLYPTDGTTADTVYGELGVASYSFEFGTAFFQDCALFENNILPNNLAALKLASRAARAPYQVAHGPDVDSVQLVPDIALPGEVVMLYARADDTRFSNANGGTQTAQPVASALGWIGTPPWMPGATASAATAVDGNFDTPVEVVQAPLSTTGLPLGRHLAWVQARDADAQDGPWSAGFITVADANSIGTLSGTVRSVATGLPIAGAQFGAASYRALTDGTGHYERRLPVGAYQPTVSAPEFESQTLPTVSIVGGSAATLDISLYALCDRLTVDAENGNQNWTPQLPWAITSAPTTQTGSRAFTDSPSGNYGNSLNLSLTSPAIDLSGYQQVVLSFDSYCDTEAGWDFGNVETSVDGGSTWSTPLWRCSGDPTLRHVSLNLPALDNISNARVRFRFTTDTNTVDDGWYVDNIRVIAGGAACRSTQTGEFADGFE